MARQVCLVELIRTDWKRRNSAYDIKQWQEGKNPDYGNVMEVFGTQEFGVLVANNKCSPHNSVPVTHRLVFGFSTAHEAEQFGTPQFSNPDLREVSLANDQTHKRIGEPGHKVVGVYRLNTKGLQTIRQDIGQRSIQMVALK